MFNFTEMVVTGLKIVFEMSVIKETNVAYWQIKGYSLVDFVDFQIHTDSIVLNSMLDLFHFIIVQFFRAYEGGYGSYVATQITDYNTLLRTRSSFFVPWPDKKHHRLNVTNSQAPELDADLQLVSLALDGSIFDSFLKTSHVEPTSTKAKRVESYTGNQVFIHQSVLSSYFYSIYDQIMPVKVDDIATSLEIIGEFPEIKKHYGGHGTAVNMSISLTPASGKFLTISLEDGIKFGKDDDMFI